VIGRIDGVVERGGAPGGRGEGVGVGGVHLPVLDGVGAAPPAAGEHPHLVAAGDERFRRRRTDRSLADDHVQCHGELLEHPTRAVLSFRSMLD
jgi:hypothetical protein